VSKYFTYPISILSGNFKPRENFILANGKRKKETTQPHSSIDVHPFQPISTLMSTSMLE
jgi:hypothetical protein